MLKTIVLGYDDSPSANAALAETIRRAPLLGADVCVVFGYYMSVFGGPAVEGESADFRSQLEKMGSRAVARAVSDLEAAGITDDLAHRGGSAGRRPDGRREGDRCEHDRRRHGRREPDQRRPARLGRPQARAALVDAAAHRPDARKAERWPTPTSSSSPATTCGCTSRGWAASARARTCRSSSRATAATSGTRTASATSTRSPGLFSVNIGYGYGEEIGQAALEQMRELPFYTNWSYAHPKAIELATELASLAPGDLNRVFFVSGGSEAVESAWKLARQYYVARGEKQVEHALAEPETRHDAIVAARRRGPHRYKAIARHIAYHGTTMGALSINGIPALRAAFEPLVPEVRHVHNTNRYHRPERRDRAGVHAVPARRPRAGDPRDGPRDGLPRPHGARAERRRLLHAARRATGRACARSATSTTSCSRPTR